MRLNLERSSVIFFLASVLSYLGTAFTNIVCLGVFTESFMIDLALSRTEISSIYFVSTCIVGLLANFSGAVYAKVGFRNSLIYGNLSLMFGFLYLSFLPFFTHCYASWVVKTLLFFGFILLQWVGQTWIVATCRSSVVKKFEGKYQNLMVAIQEAIGTIVVSAIPMILFWLIKDIGWCLAARFLCVGYAGLALMSFIFVKASMVEFASINTKPQSDKLGWHLFKRPQIWLCTFAITLPILTNSGFYFHIESIAQELNMSSISVARQIFLMAFIIVFISLACSMQIARIRVKSLIFYLLLDQILYVLSFTQINTCFGAFSHIVLGGFGWALFGFLMNTAWPRLFGFEYLNIAVAFSLSFSLLLNAFGPLLFAIGKSVAGTYKSAFYAFSLFYMLLLVAIFFLPLREKYRRTN